MRSGDGVRNGLANSSQPARSADAVADVFGRAVVRLVPPQGRAVAVEIRAGVFVLRDELVPFMRLHLEVEAPGEVDVEIEVFGCGNSRRHFPGFDPVVNREVPELLHHRNAVPRANAAAGGTPVPFRSMVPWLSCSRLFTAPEKRFLIFYPEIMAYSSFLLKTFALY